MKFIQITIGTICSILVGCNDGAAPVDTTSSDPLASMQAETSRVQRASVLDDIDLKIPDGFCLNSEYSKRGQDTVFALLNSCNSTATEGFYTVSVRKLSTGRGIGGARSIGNAFSNNQGILSAAGFGDEVLLEQKTTGNIHFIRTQDTSQNASLTETDRWRGFFIKKGVLYAVSFLPIKGSTLTTAQRFNMVKIYSSSLKL